MTEKIFRKENIEYKLECRLTLHAFGSTFSYLFKLMQRDNGKRKWRELKGYERTYRVTTEMKDILLYLKKDEVIEVANIEHQFYKPNIEF